MRATSLLTGLLGLGALVHAQDKTAPVVTDNKPWRTYTAELQEKDNTTLRGQVTTYGPTDGVGIRLKVSFWGIPEGETLQYHIHAKPVPEDGNCYATAKHLDPYGRTDTPPCDIKNPASCEVGDLSGKHGPVWVPSGHSFNAEYTDYFLSNVEGEEAFFGDLSVVVHASDTSRLNCGNFKGFFESD